MRFCLQMKRQQRKLNFLITQTELYAHFMARKLTGATDAERDAILQHFDEPVKPQSTTGGIVRPVLDDDYGMFSLELLLVLILHRRSGLMLKYRIWTSGSIFTVSPASNLEQPLVFSGQLASYSEQEISSNLFFTGRVAEIDD